MKVSTSVWLRALVAVGLLLGLPLGVQAATPGTFAFTGSMGDPRSLHTATSLANGQVLAAGGSNGGNSLASAELFNRFTGTWVVTGSMNDARDEHTATLLRDGTVLVAAGKVQFFAEPSPFILTSAELYDPSTGSWSETGSLISGRVGHTATLLPNGKVLVAGGAVGSEFAGGFPTTTTAELYDPATGTWAFTGFMHTARRSHTATLLPTGQVLVAGGFGAITTTTAAELYDPATGTWTVVGSLSDTRTLHTATLLPTGQVLVAGGLEVVHHPEGGGFFTSDDVASVELFDPNSKTWTSTGSLNTARLRHTATLLATGMVLVTGGTQVEDTILPSAELYNPRTGTWTFTASDMNRARAGHTATLVSRGRIQLGFFAPLRGGTVLIVGGFVPGPVVSETAELFFEPRPGTAIQSAP